MEHHLGFLHFTQGLGQFIGVFGVLVAPKFDRDCLNIFIVVVFELLPLVSEAFEEEIENLVQKGEDNAFRVALVHEGVGCNWSVRHLDVADLIIVDDGVASISAHAWK